jgi:hypothetical protein
LACPGTADVPTALGGARRDEAGLNYHYLVDIDGLVYGVRVPTPADTVPADTLIAIGMVHSLDENGPEHRPYPPEQLKALDGLLTLVAHGYRLRPDQIRSIEEIDKTHRRHVTGRMPGARDRVGRLLGEWRLKGAPPADVAAVHIQPVPSDP